MALFWQQHQHAGAVPTDRQEGTRRVYTMMEKVPESHNTVSTRKANTCMCGGGTCTSARGPLHLPTICPARDPTHVH